MTVTCIANTGKVLSPKYLEIGNTPDSVFHIAIKEHYQVFAIACYKGAVLLLLSDDANLPNWYPIDLFSVEDGQLPSDWHCATYRNNDDGLQFLIGYQRLISDESHYDALLERETEAVEYFRHQKVARRDPSS
jgi:hypothetical protein